ncbi:CRISPR-associated ring nuclease Csm6 [Ectothiorhodospira lacustris]|uniref:CRISPR-associated ring nuclease Csm6 n=1 Tax=Ectothiorhodospira lacustris TaxID=2899127 RepID=UPI001EE7A8B5|nr:CRISPR-associated ring nuclease Csm6 [Ectothiorhodospira lacustris]MCG5502223.1 CRISPR-associated ring nuclease Csm6 [Ectothiorhodospira lacustris]
MHTDQTLLLAITGMSPAVVTETLYAIDREGQQWPSAIKIITTSVGKKQACRRLLDEGHLNALCAELGKPQIAFSEADVLVVPGANGHAVEDARSLDDHEALANFIMQTVRDETNNPRTRIHASLAGGRKTMTFYLGYAMSLFGRHFDQLSHVLVTDGYEACKDFYYPTRNDHFVKNVSGHELNAKKAEVTLADISFIRQRSLVPALIKEVQNEINFRHLVDLINLGDQPEALKLRVHQKSQCIEIFSIYQEKPMAEVKISGLLHWCFYLLLLQDAAQPNPEDRGQYTRPTSKAYDMDLTTQLVLKFTELHDLKVEGGTGTEMIDNLLNGFYLDQKELSVNRGLEAIKGGFKPGNFSDYCRTIKSNLEEQLPKNLASHLVFEPILAVEAGDDTAGESTGNKSKRGKGNAYGITLPEPHKQITFMMD